jgi:hypothetical protein
MGSNSKVICGVCNGKGGWKKDVSSPVDDNWNQCPYCDGYGFLDDTNGDDKRKEAHILKYNHYKKLITELLSDSICSITNFTTDDSGKTIKIRVAPYNKTAFTQFAEYVLKIGHYSSKINIRLSQQYFFDEKFGKCFFYWELILEPDDLSDMDGFVDAIKIWKKVI